MINFYKRIEALFIMTMYLYKVSLIHNIQITKQSQNKPINLESLMGHILSGIPMARYAIVRISKMVCKKENRGNGIGMAPLPE